MESRENKTIKDKIDSIDTLPEEYSPNLDSKWALLEESLDKSNVSFFVKYRWLNIAAMLLLLFGFSLFYYMRDHNEEVASGEKTHPVEQTTSIASEKNIVTTQTVYTTKASIYQNNSIENKQRVAKEFINNLPIAEQAISNKEEPIQIAENSPKESATISEPVLKKKKPHYVQLDFGKAISNHENELANDSKVFQFKIGGHTENTFHLSSSGESDSPLKFRKNF